MAFKIPMGRGNFGGKRRPIVKYRDTLQSPMRAKTAELIVMLFGLWTQNGPRNQELDGVQIPPHEKGNFGWKGRPLSSIETVCNALCRNG